MGVAPRCAVAVAPTPLPLRRCRAVAVAPLRLARRCCSRSRLPEYSGPGSGILRGGLRGGFRRGFVPRCCRQIRVAGKSGAPRGCRQIWVAGKSDTHRPPCTPVDSSREYVGQERALAQATSRRPGSFFPARGGWGSQYNNICLFQDTELSYWFFIYKIKILAPKKILNRNILLVFYI